MFDVLVSMRIQTFESKVKDLFIEKLKGVIPVFTIMKIGKSYEVHNEDFKTILKGKDNTELKQKLVNTYVSLIVKDLTVIRLSGDLILIDKEKQTEYQRIAGPEFRTAMKRLKKYKSSKKHILNFAKHILKQGAK